MTLETVRSLPARFGPIAPLLAVSAGPLLLALFVLLGPFVTDPFVTQSGLGIGIAQPLMRGVPTIDPNIAITSFALGLRAAQDVVSGTLPLWNHFQGFGAPLLGEMQSAALFPPTLLLLLPSGQALEHIFLQWIAGVGAYLFFRKFGLGITAAVLGAVLYEFNGVFATLRNAAYNPVAFLPWLMFGVEAMRAEILRGGPYISRLAGISITAVAGAMALYAGFPETAYLYGLLVVLWGLYRLLALPPRQAGAFLLDLTSGAALALILSAPLLVAFATFLPEADIGGHGGDFTGMVQEKETAILYFLPYLYGLFVAAPDARVAGLSISSGGYIALAPVVFAVASLSAPGHRAVKTMLALWVVIALGLSHGWPGIYPALMALPLMKMAVVGRYLNASWIFSTVFLAALIVEQLPGLSVRERRRVLAAACVGTLGLVVAALIPSWEMIPRAWSSVKPAFLASTGGGLIAALCAGTTLAVREQRLRAALLTACLLEPLTLFVVPYFAYPRRGDVDRAALSFLRENVGVQRVAKSDGTGLAANFGAAIGVPLLHFDDLPSPRRSVEYLRTRVDSYAGTIFLPESPQLGGKELDDRRRTFRERLPAYAQAGVKYVMAAPDFHAVRALTAEYRDEMPIILEEDQELAVEARYEAMEPVTVNALTLRVSTFRNTTLGSLIAEFCAAESCAHGETDFATTDDGRLMLIRLDRPIAVQAGAGYSLIVRKRGAAAGVIWTYPRGDGPAVMRATKAPGTVKDGYNVELGFIPVERPQPVYATPSMAFYELQDVRPYAAASACDVTVRSFDEIRASCAGPSQLTRLTVHMAGWHATVNGAEVPIGITEDTFQTIDLPAGNSRILFSYWPNGLTAALVAAAAALTLVLGSFALPLLRRYKKATGAPQAVP